jgi:mRNA interferase YafQ
MKKIRLSGEFKRDLKRVIKRGKVLTKLDLIVQTLISGKAINVKHKAHKLQGSYKGMLECHIEPDWLLVYEIDDVSITLYRTGTHSDLFD